MTETTTRLYSAATALLYKHDERQPILTQRATVMLTQIFLAARKEGRAPLPYARDYPFRTHRMPGIIALVRPLDIGEDTIAFLPVAAATIAPISSFLLFRQLPRWAGALLVAAYVGFTVGGYLLYGATPGGTGS